MVLSDTVTSKSAINTFSTLEARFNQLYEYRFDYSKAVYTNNSTKITIVCKVHGEFTQSPANHLKGLTGACPKCGAKSSALSQTGNKEEFVAKANLKHNNAYTYSNFVYTTARIPSYITCKIHGDFKQSPDNHVRGGNGCPHCGSRLIKDKSKQQKCSLYVLYFPKYSLYKVGITTKSIEERMRTEKRIKYTKLLSYDFCSTVEAHKLEQVILSKLRDYKYTGEKLMTSGNTELLTVNPLKIILRKIKRGLQAKQRYTKRIKNEY